MRHLFKADRPGQQTPWGAAQQVDKVAPGIVRVHTASHGGYHITDGRFAAMPGPLALIEPFAGDRWYEEDCDAAIITLAFPEDFTDQQIRAAVKTAELSFVSWRDHAARYFKTPGGKKVYDRAKKWEADNALMYEQGCCGSMPYPLPGIFARWHRIDGGETIETYWPGFMELPYSVQPRSALEPHMTPPPAPAAATPRVVRTAGSGDSCALTPGATMRPDEVAALSSVSLDGNTIVSDADSGL